MAELPHQAEITGLLTKWREGDEQARDALFAAVYPQLRQIAARFLQRERRDHTLEPGAVVNELYLRLFGGQPIAYKDRAHFFAVAARLMRRVLVDFARAQKNQKRGGAFHRVTLDQNLAVATDAPVDLIAIDDALQALSETYERKAQVVELRFFGGLSVEETAEVLKISQETVMRDWKFAKNWLMRELSRGVRPGSDRGQTP